MNDEEGGRVSAEEVGGLTRKEGGSVNDEAGREDEW